MLLKKETSLSKKNDINNNFQSLHPDIQASQRDLIGGIKGFFSSPML